MSSSIKQNTPLLFFIHSFYFAPEGEGVRVGIPQLFFRFQGCKVGCFNCDSKETWKFPPSQQGYSFEEVALQTKNLLEKYPVSAISITGGDPLDGPHLKQTQQLVAYFQSLGLFVNIEAAGTVYHQEIFSNVNFISFDLKTPSTRIKEELKKLNLENAKKLIANHCVHSYQIKAVVESMEDFDWLYKTIKELIPDLQRGHDKNLVITVAFNKKDKNISDRFSLIAQLNNDHGNLFRIIAQQHKLLFGTDNLLV